MFIGVVYVSGHTRIRQQLRHTAVPSVFFWWKLDTPSAQSRRARAARRGAATVDCVVSTDSAMDIPTVYESSVDTFPHANDVNGNTDNFCVNEEIISTDCDTVDVATQSDTVITLSTYSQTDTSIAMSSVPFLSISNLNGDHQLLHYYTGLESTDKLMTVFATLGPAVNYLTYFRTQTVTGISPLNQFILMLAKLRQDLDYLPLARLCGISPFTAQNIFITWINFCARQWSEINFWPDKDLVQFYAPDDFHLKFPTTRLIIDGTEIPIQKPSNPLAQRCTFSSYKNRNTVKVLVGSTPGGLISYLSPAYGWATSDRQVDYLANYFVRLLEVVERSSLPEMCDASDSVMADKGFNVQDLFAARDIHVNIPTFFKKKNRMSGRQVLDDMKISSKRVHIERIIGLMKTYKILTSPLPASEAKLASHIVTVCATLCNFRNRIVSQSA